MQNYNLKLLFKTLTGGIPLPSEMDDVYKSLVRAKLAPKAPEVYKRGPLDRETEILLRNLDVKQIHELTELLQVAEIGGFRILAFSVNLKKEIFQSGGIISTPGVLFEKTDGLPPLKYDLIRDPGQPEWMTDIVLWNIKNEPLPLNEWRSFFISCQKSDILSQYEPDYVNGQTLQTLRIKRMQPPQTAKLIEIITQNPEIGAFKLQCTSNRVQIPKNDGSLRPKDADMIISTFDMQKTTDKLNAELAERYRFETPVRLGLDGIIKE